MKTLKNLLIVIAIGVVISLIFALHGQGSHDKNWMDYSENVEVKP